jgi:signal transduction histidine kinase
MHLKIWHKMIIGISIPSFIVLLGVILTFIYLNDVKNRHGYVQVADDLREHVLEVRRNEKNFIHFKNSEHLKSLFREISVLDNSIKYVPPEAIEEIGKGDFSLLSESLRKYSGLIDDLYRNYQQEAEIIEVVRTEGRKLEAYAASGKHSEKISINFILDMRRLEKNYMLFRDRESFFKLNNALSQMTDMIPFCSDCGPYVTSVRNLISTYEKSDSMVNSLQVSGNSLEEITTRISGRERNHIDSFFTMTQRLLFAVLVLVCTLGPLLVYKTSNHIATPIKRLSEIARKISGGSIELRAPIKEKDETFDLAQSFNIMLDNLQLTTKSLERSLELLKEKQDQLIESEKLASIGRLCSGIAHEINNPLTSVLTFSSLMLENMPADDPRYGRLSMIVNETTRARNIVRQVLSFARESPLMIEKMDINRPVREIINSLVAQNAFTDIELIQDLSENLPEVNIDPARIGQVVSNMLLNAVHAISPPGKIEVSSRLAGDHIELIFSDSGYGIPEENIKKIFDPFFSTKDSTKGTGLGLAVTYGIIKKHGGDIEVKSTVGAGSTFIVRLPINGK